MNNDIYLIGEVGWEITLDSVVKAVNDSDKSKPLNVHIHSGGGSVYDGLAIYNYFKNLDQEVNTSSSGLVASIASIIFLAGKKETRSINATDSFLIHLPSGMIGGEAEDFEKHAKELRNIESNLADIYVLETNLTKEEAMAQMKEDAMIAVEWLKEKGFVNNIVEFKAVATYKKRDMSGKGLTEKETENLLEKFYNKFFPKKDPTNKIVQDANGVDIDFTEVEDSAEPKVGDVATVEGAKAEGDYVMPSGETFKFTDGALTEIVEAEGDDDTDELAEAHAEIERLKEELQASAVLVTTKETEITEATNKLDGIKIEFEELKNNVTSNFDYKGKKTKKKEPSKEGSRTLFKQ